jgi:hypothetical protein
MALGVVAVCTAHDGEIRFRELFFTAVERLVLANRGCSV